MDRANVTADDRSLAVLGHLFSSGCTPRGDRWPHNGSDLDLVLRLSVIYMGQSYKLPGFKDPAREMPTPPTKYIQLRAALRHRRPAYFLRRGGNLGMKGNSATAL